MTTLKIAVIAGSLIVAAGGSAAVATRSKWLPQDNKGEVTETKITQPVQVPPATNPAQATDGPGDTLASGTGTTRDGNGGSLEA